MAPATWDLLIGALLILMALSGTLLKTLPVSAAALYLVIGFAVGPGGLALLRLDLTPDDTLIEHVSEVAVLLSLFAVGLRLQIRTQLSSWTLPVLLATVGMILTVAFMTAAGLALHWSLPGALLLAAILAPTDPVLASDVQVRHENDGDELRFALTAEGGLNDGAAFALVLLALGLLGAHTLGVGGWRWLAMDVVWAVAGGLALGWTCGAAFTRLTLFLQTQKQQALGMESFLALGLIALTYGIALHASVYGFLAVFVAGLSMRHVERTTVAKAEDAVDKGRRAEAPTLEPGLKAQAETAQAMTRDVLGFAKELEKFVELGAMLMIGCLMRMSMFTWRNLLLAALLLAIARPVAVYLTTRRSSRWTPSQRRLGAWFGIRGVGSIYYLAYASAHGAAGSELDATASVVLVTVAVSVLLHGASAAPLMRLYRSTRKRPPET
ncbi:cation:proton antiporter [Variovorax sp. J22R24]|uniref:cation:proton antiporter domain-containing protein n=1 Tax=Variovorax gracilis TaxID=3053502 RepID=UPI0025781FFF|nr:cation:proton antiporter [Variovorax sp. J22R24]MDM0110252.1 cation:proton antiporter [Variovorax sp. J22R24]